MSDKSGGQRFLADALMAVGALITVLCGGCTVFYLGANIWPVVLGVLHHGPLTPTNRDQVNLLPVVGVLATIVGGLPTVVGVALFIIGRGLKRRAMAPPRRDHDSTAS